MVTIRSAVVNVSRTDWMCASDGTDMGGWEKVLFSEVGPDCRLIRKQKNNTSVMLPRRLVVLETGHVFVTSFR